MTTQAVQKAASSSGPIPAPITAPVLSPAPAQTSTAAPSSSSSAAQPRRVMPAGRAAIDPLSDKATRQLIRRTLCPEALDPKERDRDRDRDQKRDRNHIRDLAHDLPLPPTSRKDVDLPLPPLTSRKDVDLPLPPLTSRNDVDLQLYALLAIIVREFVQTWYSKISPDDDQFVAEIVQIVAHCTRALEQRLRAADLESLLLDELPEVLDSHLRAYRAAFGRLVPPPLATDPRAAYHALCPLPALEPVPGPGPDSDSDFGPASAPGPDNDAALAANESAYRQLLVRALLSVLLPPEDLQNECLNALLGQILAELVLGNLVARRLSEPWMIYELIGMAARLLQEKREPPTKTGREEGAGSISGSPSASDRSLFAMAAPLVWTVVRFGFAIFAALRFIIGSISLARSLPPRTRPAHETDPTDPTAEKALPHSWHAPPPAPVLAFRLWPALVSLSRLDERMPWLCGFLSMLQWLAMAGPGRLAALDGPLDRLLSYYACRFLLDPDRLPALLRAARAAVFPGNKFGAAPPSLVAPADAAALAALKRRTAEAVVAVAASNPLTVLVRRNETLVAEVEDLLDVFSDAYANRHCVYSLVETVLVRVAPELTEPGVLGLWAAAADTDADAADTPGRKRLRQNEAKPE